VANAACNYISTQAWDHKTFKQFPIHKLTSYNVKEMFKLTAQVVVCCISKVADSYKLDKKIKRTFKSPGAVAFDNRILTYRMDSMELNIWMGQAKDVLRRGLPPDGTASQPARGK
jgi:putative transposase